MIDGSGSVSLGLMDPDPGGPQNYGSYGSGSATLLSNTFFTHVLVFFIVFFTLYVGATPENEIQIYTWMDASLKEITGLVKEVNPDARK
jgi:hypothetical protein